MGDFPYQESDTDGLQVQLPLQIGTRVDCRWRDGEYYTARVVERRLLEGSDVHEYYVHYLKCGL